MADKGASTIAFEISNSSDNIKKTMTIVTIIIPREIIKMTKIQILMIIDLI